MSVEFQLDEIEDKAITLKIKGDIDMSASPEVRNMLTSFFKKKKAIIVDLSDVSYMDSSGIATLVEGLQWSHNSKNKFRLVGLSPAVKDIFEIAHLLTVFEIFDSEEKALKEL